MKHAMAKPKKSWKERLRIFLLVLCSVVFVVSAGMLVYYLLWEPYQHNQKSVEIQQIYPTRGVEDTTSSEEVNSEGTLSKFDELRALNPDAQIILLGYTNPVPLLPEWTQLFRRLNALSKSLAAQNENVTYVPIPFAMTATDAHPTVSGHKYIANRILRAIKK